MAKEIIVAKQAFDDGTKKGPGGKGVAYNVGEEYKGDAKLAAALKKRGLLCSASELAASQEQLDEKDQVIRKLEGQIEDLKVKNEELSAVVRKLEAQIEESKEAAKAKK